VIPHIAVGEGPGEFGKADIFNRLVAKVIDIMIAVALSEVLPPVGFFAGLFYLLIADAFFDGRSIGKRLVGLRTTTARGAPCTFKDSTLRNLTVAFGYILFFIPYIGWLLAVIIYLLEGLVMVGNEKGLRIGDELAKTYVVESNYITTPQGNRRNNKC